jgi:hypothetical protein
LESSLSLPSQNWYFRTYDLNLFKVMPIHFTGYYYLPKMFQVIYFKKIVTIPTKSKSIAVCFADGGIAQFNVQEGQKSCDIIEQICLSIGISNHGDYCFQLVEGDFKKPRWLAKFLTLGLIRSPNILTNTYLIEEQSVQKHHILRLVRRIFYPLGYFRNRAEAVLLYPQVGRFI